MQRRVRHVWAALVVLRCRQQHSLSHLPSPVRICRKDKESTEGILGNIVPASLMFKGMIVNLNRQSQSYRETRESKEAGNSLAASSFWISGFKLCRKTLAERFPHSPFLWLGSKHQWRNHPHSASLVLTRKGNVQRHQDLSRWQTYWILQENLQKKGQHLIQHESTKGFNHALIVQKVIFELFNSCVLCWTSG